MAFESRQQVQHGDAGHDGRIAFPRYWDLFQRAVEDFFAAEVGDSLPGLAEREHLAFPVVRLESDFHAPLAEGDVVTVRLWTERLGEHAATLRAEVHHADEAPVSRSRLVLCCVELPWWKKASLPPAARAAFARHLAPAPTAAAPAAVEPV